MCCKDDCTVLDLDVLPIEMGIKVNIIFYQNLLFRKEGNVIGFVIDTFLRVKLWLSSINLQKLTGSVKVDTKWCELVGLHFLVLWIYIKNNKIN